MTSLSSKVQTAVSHFWKTRTNQESAQGAVAKDRDKGGRRAATGGKQMDGFVRLVRDALLERGLPAKCVHLEKRLELPGWFRAEKKWDLVVIHDSQLVAALEFKSQVGSFGNNFNNRSEEAIGSATDLWAAYREGAFKPSARPWLGYLMLLEDCEGSREAVKCREPNFETFPEFKGASYARRYEILIEKLLRDRLYDGACLLLSDAVRGVEGHFLEPNIELSFERLVTPLLGHVAAICEAK